MPGLGNAERNPGDVRAGYPDPASVVAEMDKRQMGEEAATQGLENPVIGALQTLQQFAMAQGDDPTIKQALGSLVGAIQQRISGEGPAQPGMETPPMEGSQPEADPMAQQPMEEPAEEIPADAKPTGEGVEDEPDMQEMARAVKRKSKAIPNQTRVMV